VPWLFLKRPAAKPGGPGQRGIREADHRQPLSLPAVLTAVLVAGVANAQLTNPNKDNAIESCVSRTGGASDLEPAEGRANATSPRRSTCRGKKQALLADRMKRRCPSARIRSSSRPRRLRAELRAHEREPLLRQRVGRRRPPQFRGCSRPMRRATTGSGTLHDTATRSTYRTSANCIWQQNLH